MNYPNVWIRNSRQFKELIARVRMETLNRKVAWHTVEDVKDENWSRIVKWLNYIIRRPERSCKKMHLWVYSEPNMGKTSMLSNPLERRLHVYKIQKDEVQNTPWEGPYDIAICDE